MSYMYKPEWILREHHLFIRLIQLITLAHCSGFVNYSVSPGFRLEVAKVDANVIDLPQLHDRAFDLFRSLMPTAEAVKYMKMDYEG